jgi:hypothetical protein
MKNLLMHLVSREDKNEPNIDEKRTRKAHLKPIMLVKLSKGLEELRN